MWLKPQGQATITTPGEARVNLDGFRTEAIAAGHTQYDTASCGHCNRIFHVGPRQRPEDIGGLCKQCFRIICPHCVDQGCSPLEKRLEEMEQRERVLRSYGMG